MATTHTIRIVSQKLFDGSRVYDVVIEGDVQLHVPSTSDDALSLARELAATIEHWSVNSVTIVNDIEEEEGDEVD